MKYIITITAICLWGINAFSQSQRDIKFVHFIDSINNSGSISGQILTIIRVKENDLAQEDFKKNFIPTIERIEKTQNITIDLIKKQMIIEDPDEVSKKYKLIGFKLNYDKGPGSQQTIIEAEFYDSDLAKSNLIIYGDPEEPDFFRILIGIYNKKSIDYTIAKPGTNLDKFNKEVNKAIEYLNKIREERKHNK